MPRVRVPRFHVGGRPPGAYPAPVDQFWSIISHPVAIGLALGLLVAAFTWKSGLTARRALRREVARLEQAQAELQGHLNTQLKISATGSRQVLAELEELRRQNENLRVNLAQFQQKPGRAEIRQLHILEAAARRMRERAPGFAPAWEQALLDHPRYSPPLRQWRERRAISRKAKVSAVLAMSAGVGFTWLTVGWPWVLISVAVLVIAGSWIWTRAE